MQKVEFIEHVAKEAGVNRSEADKVVRAMLRVIESALTGGDKVTLTGFGTFEVRDRGERQVTSIRTKEKVTVPASRLPSFSAGSELKGSLNNKETKTAEVSAETAKADTSKGKTDTKKKTNAAVG